MELSKIADNLSIEQAQRILENFPYSPWQVVAATTGSYLVYKLAGFVKWWLIDPQFSPLRDAPGPDTYDSIIWGNMPKIFKAPPSKVHEEWMNKYGHTITYRGMFLGYRLCTKDPKALAHMVNHSYDYPKPAQIRYFLERMFGKGGVLFAEGEDHRRQRKIMNPCFGPAQIRDLMPIFLDKAFQLRDIWIRQVEESGQEDKEIDVMVWLTRATLDVIGLAGFDYEFNTLTEGEKNELVLAFMELFAPAQGPPFLALLSNFIPFLRMLPTKRARASAHSKEVMARIGKQLVQDKRAAVVAATSGSGGVEKKTVVGRDLLSVLIKANMARDVKDSERMSDEEVMGQIMTMLIAGHETTATSLTWLLYDLSQPEHKHIQNRLREELLTLKSDRPTMEELNSLPYLDAVVRENLRINSVVDSTIRCAGKDDYIPVSTPYTDKNGVERTEIRIAAGEQIFIPVALANRDKAIWGEDADVFNPDRWLEGNNSHPRSAEIPGVFSTIMTFLGGPRACIGYRFALMEMKALIFALIRDMAYELPDPAPKIERKSQ
ncbi:hypothetical protein M407DRAFT_64608 [Tulasnella calospora MUT 4182]|uniref:Cytochrome P450 n=1 Tax=Tulasnella calospora MUT 4182 TaxID=1051891 RepID=A0A0C3QMC3_9AGAM|nr:hypothetical protein M407DRAFT_64608 [Tulasnella calospora MUT 4182]